MKKSVIKGESKMSQNVVRQALVSSFAFWDLLFRSWQHVRAAEDQQSDEKPHRGHRGHRQVNLPTQTKTDRQKKTNAYTQTKTNNKWKTLHNGDPAIWTFSRHHCAARTKEAEYKLVSSRNMFVCIIQKDDCNKQQIKDSQANSHKISQ